MDGAGASVHNILVNRSFMPSRRARRVPYSRKGAFVLPIVIAPDPLLATVCEPCDLSDKSLKRLSNQMAHAM